MSKFVGSINAHAVVALGMIGFLAWLAVTTFA